jgi:hypothetical protein
MQVYSKKIISFIQEIKKTVKEIISKEVGLKVFGDRFHDKKGTTSYPLKIVIYNNKRMLGYFDSDFFELGFHEQLMHSSKKLLNDIIRHELGHYMTFIEYGEGVQSHGTEFRSTCRNLGWGEEVYKATTCLDDGASSPDEGESAILRKVQKLMSLAASNNEHEAEQAMIKSQQLLLKHNIDFNYVDEEKVFLKRILKQKRENAKMRSIARILETFFVNIVYSRCAGFVCLEIVGSAVNIEIAEYVAAFLERELEILWDISKQKYSSLKGPVAKNSFFLGIAKGYCNKINSLKKEYPGDTANALMVIEKKLIDAKAMIYSRLRSTSSNGRFCRESSSLGEQVGKNLTINPAVNSRDKTTKPLSLQYN